ncbi:MAG: hypothetical protein ACR2QS_08710 [Woeseiaceae bacterium]
MSDVISSKPSTNFWIIGGAALVWNLIGLVIYIGQVSMSPEALARLTEAQQDLITSTPTWANAAWAIAVNAGLFGSALMLLRKTWAIPMFALSLAAIIVQDIDAFVLRDAFGVVGINSLIIPSMVLAIAIALLLYSRTAKSAGWLN